MCGLQDVKLLRTVKLFQLTNLYLNTIKVNTMEKIKLQNQRMGKNEFTYVGTHR